jgi:uncharacterized protein DUF4154
MEPTSPSSNLPLPQTRRSAFLPAAFRFLLIFSLLAAQISAPPVAADQAIAGEYELKAAMLYNLMKFVDWPPSDYPNSQAPQLLCVLGADPFGHSLASLASKASPNDRPVQIRHVQDDGGMLACQVLYISSSERKRLAQILSNLKTADVLTVGEMSQFAARGGMVQFALEGKRVRFEINLDAASQSRLKISSHLLALAHVLK